MMLGGVPVSPICSSSSVAVPVHSPLSCMIEEERNELLSKAVDQLPEIQRRRFLLYYEYDFNFYQIAGMEHCTASAVQKSVSVAREKVKAEMRKYLQP